MRINPEEVARVARLARLSLTFEEETAYAREFDDILAHFAVIDGYDLTGDVAFRSDQAVPELLRQDKPKLFEDQSKLHHNVKKMKNGLIEVPKILE
ncbi:MAG: Asp-tRNA(Asn)/Glu-tRNA(Gln) amidotransferase subunit GatC [Bacillota bacterium]|nr:Asp-tRNA(Asn)/Glu-tRNA(Gln) amidotransferase subunit GatC [Bacillota bacterium]MDW7677811.1 Asp-tRNA(Asn)/Glu-tRNA(Gln) amidotransferase subunit GatC [Bacillota bacterium]